LKVIDLTVENGDDAAVLVADGLFPAAQVNDAEPAHTKGQVPIHMHTRIVGAPMVDDLEHIAESPSHSGPVSFVFVETADAAHGWFPES